MSIDGIGRPPIPPGGATGVSGPSAAAGTGESFEVASPEAAAGTQQSPLARLSSGELSLDEYLDLRVREAVGPLASKLGPAELEMIQGSLRAQLETDPVLIELVRRATGSTPTGTER
jgi:hypothetical protein